MLTVANMLSQKGNVVYSVTSTIMVYDALKIMGEKNIGALLVIENDILTGILSERDYARKVVLQGKNSRETTVGEIMTANVITVAPSDSIDTCMSIMSNKHIRHLPVLNNNQVAGIISISDVVTAIIQSQQETIDYLKSYITQ